MNKKPEPHTTKLTPMMQQYQDAKSRHPHDLLFFRMGDFYEMMFDDAVEASQILGIMLTKRGKGTACEAPMCGVPFHAAESYIAKLVKAGKRVAICEQVEDPKSAKGLVRREVIRVITPSTILDDKVLDQKDFQYLAAILEHQDQVGAAFLEFTTGAFHVMQAQGHDRHLALGDQLSTHNPTEILLSEEVEYPWLDPGFLDTRCVTRLDSWNFSLARARQCLIDHFNTLNLEGFGLEDQPLAIRAAGAALDYVLQTQGDQASHITDVRVLHQGQNMVLDHTTQRNLELTRSLYDGSRHDSLLGQIDLCETAMGSRLLKEWILTPLMDVTRIHDRQTYVTSYRDATIPRSELRLILKTLPDMDRLITRLALGTILPRDLLAIGQALQTTPHIIEQLDAVTPDRYGVETASLETLAAMEHRICQAVVDEPPGHLRSGGYIRPGMDAELDELRGIRNNSRQLLLEMEAREREATSIPKLKVQYNKVFGYYIEISKVHTEKVPPHYVRKQTLVNSERYITDELKQFEERILGAEEKIIQLETRLYEDLVETCRSQLSELKQWSSVLARIDVHAALAELAVQRNYCRPQVHEGPDIAIKEGRHPVVEVLSRESFIPNDTYLDQQSDRLLIITGPNMGGKSTYLRQVALICLMAQIGSYVPASSAEIGVVDRIFTRVGASDQLARGQSTFMVEMTETANILHHATAHSLIILDEIGRGTATFDGLSIAWACAEFIADPQRIGAKTLFATHYHELTELEKLLEGVRNLHITVREWKHEIVFLRRVERGCADKSYGIHVAKLAGLPKDLVRRAYEILHNLEQNELDATGNPKLARGREPEPPEAIQLSLFGPERSPVLEELESLDVDDLSPRKALDLLYRWKRELSS